jgi:hypothetical protein
MAPLSCSPKEGTGSSLSLGCAVMLGRGIHLYRETEKAVPLKLQRTKVIRSDVLLN